MGDQQSDKDDSPIGSWNIEEDRGSIYRWEEEQDGYASRWNLGDEPGTEKWENYEQGYGASGWNDAQGYGQPGYGNNGHWSQNKDNFDDIQAETYEGRDEQKPLHFLTQLKLDFESMFSGNKRFHSIPKDKLFTR